MCRSHDHKNNLPNVYFHLKYSPMLPSAVDTLAVYMDCPYHAVTLAIFPGYFFRHITSVRSIILRHVHNTGLSHSSIDQRTIAIDAQAA